MKIYAVIKRDDVGNLKFPGAQETTRAFTTWDMANEYLSDQKGSFEIIELTVCTYQPAKLTDVVMEAKR